MLPSKEFPAPWKLRGRGYMLLYKFERRFIAEQGFVPAWLSSSFIGGLGSVMLVDYQESNAGPYKELLFIPGRFDWQGWKRYSITKIYVTTMASVENGRRNWAIPKELADITIQDAGRHRERFCITTQGRSIMDITMSYGSLPIPVHTAFLPFPLIQREEGVKLVRFRGNGMGRLAKIRSATVDPTLFPNITTLKPLVALRVDPFYITFKKAISLEE